jgi:hypothetical protein
VSGVVNSAADLTAEWLTETLGTDVRSVVHERIGSGVTGAAYRLALDSDGGPDALVAKIAAGDEEARYRVRNGYRAEVGLYVDLAKTVDIRTPHCWHAAIDDDGTGGLRSPPEHVAPIHGDYRLGQLQAPMITTIRCMYATVERTEEADRMFLAMARRSCAAIRDLDALDAVAAA